MWFYHGASMNNIIDKQLQLKAVFIGLSIFAIVWISRLVVIHFYGVNLPLADQWDAEINELYLPCIHHTLLLKAFFIAHNEHRILFTRLLNLLLFICNGGYNPIIAVRLQAAIPAITAMLLVIWNIRAQHRINHFSLLIITLVFALPIGFENLLCSFQSQFYFMILFSMIALKLVTSPNVTFVRFLWILLFSVFAFFSVGSGFFVALTAGLILLYLSFADEWNVKYFVMGMVLVCLALAMYFFFTPAIPVYELSMVAKSNREFLIALFGVLIWPYGAGLLWWLPLFVLVGFKKYREQYQIKTMLFPLALYFWLGLQFIAIAYARGEINPRYLDIILMGIIALVFLLDQLPMVNGKKFLCCFSAAIKITMVLLLVGMSFEARKYMDYLYHKRWHCFETIAETAKLIDAKKPQAAYERLLQGPLPYPFKQVGVMLVWNVLYNQPLRAKMLFLRPH